MKYIFEVRKNEFWQDFSTTVYIAGMNMQILNSIIDSMSNNRYDSLSEATKELAKKGYTANFKVNNEGKLENSKDSSFSPKDVKLEEFHRFEGMTNPADSTILYVVETSTGLKGLVVDSYGANGSEVTSAFMNKVEQNQFKQNK
ncbi:MAG TPA: hypothetical protein VKA10_04570 [Prolixibacteraceae bacterium]|nr:hypothetical protein [Prolixibacteraceae bacterium]